MTAIYRIDMGNTQAYSDGELIVLGRQWIATIDTPFKKEEVSMTDLTPPGPQGPSPAKSTSPR